MCARRWRQEQSPRTAAGIGAPFFSRMFFVFLTRTVPASSSAKPHCMKKTRKEHCSTPAEQRARCGWGVPGRGASIEGG